LLEPFLQGELDGLCGLYAIINGIRLALGPERQMPDAVWVDMFGGMLRAVAERHSRGDPCAAGYSLRHLQRLQNTSIIVGFGGLLDHWTVIKQVSPHYIRFFDSSGCSSVRLDRCRLSYESRLETATEHILYVSSIIMIAVAPYR
jgi:hypothetical protein